MSEAYAAAHIAQELGITVLADDVPKIVAAIHRAYAVGQRDGAAAEREACAVLLERMTERRRWTRAGINGEPTMPCEYAAAIRARGAA